MYKLQFALPLPAEIKEASIGEKAKAYYPQFPTSSLLNDVPVTV